MEFPKKIGVFLILLMIVPVVASIEVGISDGEPQIGIDLIPETPTNYSAVNVNNSEYLQGYTPTTLKDWIQGLFDSIYCKLTGCTMEGNIDMNKNNITNVADLYFDTTNCVTDGMSEGRVCWDNDKKTLSIDSGLGTVLQVGQEQTRAVKNKAGQTIYAGQITYISGSSGELETVMLADSSNDTKMHNLAMVTQPSCNNNALCQVTTVGLVHDIDTSMWIEGDHLYLSADGSGNATTTQPNFPNYNIHLGVVTRSHANTGMVAFYPEIDWGDGTTIHSLGILTNLTVNGWINGKFNWTSGDDWNSFDGSTLLFNDSKLATTFYNATQASAIRGTIDGGTLEDTQHPDGDYDGVTFNFSEEAGAVGLDLRVNFTSVDGFNKGYIRYKTSSLSGDYPEIQLWNYDESEWEGGYGYLSETENFLQYTNDVLDSSEHLQGGIIQMRLYKEGNGNTNNHYYVDMLAVVDGYATPSGNVDLTPYWRYDDNDESRNFLTDGNVTADTYFGDGSELIGNMSFDKTNIAYTNKSNIFTKEQVFNDNFTGNWSGLPFSWVSIIQKDMYGAIKMPVIEGHSSLGATRTSVGLRDGIYVFATTGINPSIILAKDDLLDSAEIRYDLTSSQLNFTLADKYNFDDSMSINGNLTLDNDGLFIGSSTRIYNDGTDTIINTTSGSLFIYNDSGWGNIEYGSAVEHTYITQKTNKEAYELVEYAEENGGNDGNYSAWEECYSTKNIKDYSRPEIEYYEKEVCEIDIIIGGEHIKENCENKIFENITYPYTKVSEGINVGCKSVMIQKAYEYSERNIKHLENITQFENSVLAEHYITNTTKEPETLNKLEIFYDALSTKTYSQMKDMILTLDGKLSDNILFDYEKSDYGSYNLEAIGHTNRAMNVLMLWKISKLEDRQQQQLDCWDLSTQSEIVNCMKNID